MGSLHKQKIICLGLGRTGVSSANTSLIDADGTVLKTSSLRDALDMLGFGPCYHMMTLVDDLGGKDFPTWHKFANGKGIP